MNDWLDFILFVIILFGAHQVISYATLDAFTHNVLFLIVRHAIGA